jgi:hypothetical protein
LGVTNEATGDAEDGVEQVRAAGIHVVIHQALRSPPSQPEPVIGVELAKRGQAPKSVGMVLDRGLAICSAAG